jgi:hypothetical protein
LMPVFPWFMAGLQVALGGSAIVQWALTGDPAPLLTFFRLHSPLVLCALALFEYLAAVACCRQFERGEPLRQAWLFIAAASGCRLTGMAVTSFFGWFSGRGIPALPETASLAAAVPDLNLAIVRPLCAALLGVGLLRVIMLHRSVDLLRRSGPFDRALLAVAALLALAGVVVRSGSFAWLGAQSIAGGARWLSGAALGFLLVEAVLLRRPVLQMGDGLVGRVWGAYVAAIFLTVVGDLAAWAVSSAAVAWQYSWVHTSVWLLAGLSYALAPAYQIQAIVGAKTAQPQWDCEADALPEGGRA